MAENRSTGIASSSNLSSFRRVVQSILTRRIGNPARTAAKRRKAEKRRLAAGEPLRIDYFHQVGDAYSHLAAQAIPRLLEAYDIEIVPRLVGPTDSSNAPEAELLARYAQRDSADIAPHYGLEFPKGSGEPEIDAIALAERILASASTHDFAARAVAVGKALWSGDATALAQLAQQFTPADGTETNRKIQAGTELRKKLGHYSGAMFHYAGEWYWGVDRLRHLESHLREIGVARSDSRVQFPRPALADVSGAQSVTLEYFPSLRSPYTAIGFDSTTAFAERSDVRFVLRPVLPMVMRGVPATFVKGRYIFSDTWREAAFDGVPFGKILDPIGRPVERAYSLFPWARDQGKGGALISAFLRSAFAEGVNTSRDAGLQKVVEAAGLSWTQAQPHLDSEEWRDELEANRLTMYEHGLWGVPSYRVSGPDGRPDFACWGQDRLWLVSHEIASRIR